MNNIQQNTSLRLGIVGYGFVGKATDWGFNKNTNKFLVDPILNTTIDDLQKFNPEITFICVPTPMGQDGTQDSKIIESVIKELAEKCPETIIVVKSTVLPPVLQKLKSISSNLIYNPEFLREKHANYDFENSNFIILGGEESLCIKLSDAYKSNSRCKTTKHLFTDLYSASLVKYSINTFLATKVIFFNEIYQVFQKLDTNDDWAKIISAISNDNRIGNSHMDVPGHDGRLGFGGACFPKDSNALALFAKSVGIELSVLNTAIKTNNSIRKKYAEMDSRESEQNVSFDDKI